MTVLFKRHFQVAYLVADIRVGMKVLGERYGVADWDLMDMAELHGPGVAMRYIANAWVDDVMIELIEPDETVDSIYRAWKLDGGTLLRFHHLGFLVDSAEEFDAAKARLVAAGFPVVAEGSFGEVLDFAYADTTSELGHYYEIIRLKSQGDSFFGRIPVN